MIKLVIAGCGYVGMALSAHVSKQGFSVWGLRRTDRAKREIEASGATFICADLTKPKTLTSLPEADYVVSCQAPRGPRRDYRRTYLEGANNLVQALVRKPPLKFLWVSSTSVYGQSSGKWVDEQTSPEPAMENAKVLLDVERIVLKAPFPSMVLRLGGIYGPGRDRVKLLQRGVVSPRDPGYLNHIHVEDIVRLIPFLLQCGRDKEIYLGVDNEPVLRSEFYTWLSRRGGISFPDIRKAGSSRSVTNKRCSNQKIRSLGFHFLYPTYQEGYSKLTKLCAPSSCPKQPIKNDGKFRAVLDLR